MAWIKREVDKLVKKYKTNCPYQLAEQLGIHVVFWDFHEEIHGVYYYTKRNKFIYINNNLNSNDQRFTCSHELGHAIFHPKLSTPFMRTNTLFSVDKIEREANRFAAELLIPDDVFLEYNNIYDIASLHQVPVELVRLKCKKLF